MNLYPAIDIYQGNAVRLRQGRREEATIYGSPLEMARRWIRSGARWLHVIDLDGAFEGRPRNTAAIEEIRALPIDETIANRWLGENAKALLRL